MAKQRYKGSLKPTLNEFYDCVSDVLNGISRDLYAAVDRGLDRASFYLKEKLETETPKKTWKTSMSWEVDLKYRNVRYIHNGRKNARGIPIVNLLEFAKNGKPFLRRTIQTETSAVVNIIKEEIQHGNTR